MSLFKSQFLTYNYINKQNSKMTSIVTYLLVVYYLKLFSHSKCNLTKVDFF